MNALKWRPSYSHFSIMKGLPDFLPLAILTDKVDLLHLIEGYGLVRAVVAEGSPLEETTLAASQLTAQGVLVLGIERGTHWIPTPPAAEKIQHNDRLVVYGPLARLREVFGQ